MSGFFSINYLRKKNPVGSFSNKPLSPKTHLLPLRAGRVRLASPNRGNIMIVHTFMDGKRESLLVVLVARRSPSAARRLGGAAPAGAGAPRRRDRGCTPSCTPAFFLELPPATPPTQLEQLAVGDALQPRLHNAFGVDAAASRLASSRQSPGGGAGRVGCCAVLLRAAARCTRAPCT